MSVAALLVPVLGALRFPEQLGEYGAYLWLLLLLPAFLLAYYQGWRGAATALATGMATLSVTQAVSLWLGAPIPDILVGVVAGYAGTVLGIGWMAEGLHRQRAVVENMAFTDLLTRLPNRRRARIFLDNEFAAAERGRALSVVLFDLDRFKEYNDRHGHAAGDEALRTFSDILGTTTRRADLSARFGGEEFLSVLTGTDAEGAVVFADRIRVALEETRMERGALTVSAGAASYHSGMRSPDELLEAADQALYQAKRSGRNCVRLYRRDPADQAPSSMDALEGTAELVFAEEGAYARVSDGLGRSDPPPSLLPYRITGYGEGRSVLVVESDAQVRKLVSGYLRREGFAVREAASVPEGRAALSDEFDLVVSDLHLLGESGSELVSAGKSRWPLTQVVVITGTQDPETAAEALRAGADRYLFKPFGLSDLRTELVSALERRDILDTDRAERRLHLRDGGPEAAARGALLVGARHFVTAAEARFPSTAGHASRVAAVARRLAFAVDPREEHLDPDALCLACELKDLGNVSLPVGLLELPRSLTPEERARMESHPRTGRGLLDALYLDGTVREVTAWHHERWDGAGYPDHLTGTAIPLSARVASVADALASMTASRPYRERRSLDEAFRELRREAGGQFDPGVVQAAEACAGDLEAILLPMRRAVGD